MEQQQTQKQQSDISLREIFYLFWRRKMIVFLCLFGCLLGAGFIISKLTPLYSARALIKIEGDQTAPPKAIPDMEVVLSEVQILQSQTLAAQVVQTLNLAKEGQTRTAVDVILSSLSVRPLGQSLVVEVLYKGNDAKRVAQITNEIVVQYIKGQIGAKNSDNKQTAAWLDKRLKDLEVRVRQSAQAVEEYRSKHALVGGYKGDVTSQQISELNTQFMLSKTRTAEAEAKLDQVNAIASGRSSLSALPDAINSSFIQNLKQEEVKLSSKLSELRTRYGEKHPDVIVAQAELRAQRQKIKREIEKITQSISSDVDIARARQQSLEEALDELEQQRGSENQSSIELQALEREAQANKELYETFLTQFKENDQQKDNHRPNARIISRADVPLAPIWPNKYLIFFLAGLSGLIIGVTGALVMEGLDNGYRTSRDLEEIFKIPAITMVPLMDKNKKGIQTGLADFIIDKPYSAVAEAIRSLRVSLALRHNPDVKVISITSSVPGEGKTTLSLWLARAMANSGKKTLLIDCDLRRPSVHHFFNDKNEITLVDVLLGKNSAEELISVDQKTGLHRIYARPMEKGEADILSSGGMEQLITHLRDVYDLIILDTPPSLAVSDSRILSKLADKVLYVVQWKKTPREVVNTAVRHLLRDDIDIAGFVISQVNTKEHAKYHFGDMGSYYIKYHDYFSE